MDARDPVAAATLEGRDPAAIGAVALTVADLAGATRFYSGPIGLEVLGHDADGAVRLGTADGTTLVVLHGHPAAPPRDPHRSGLFHLAVLMPSRPALGTALARLVAARWPLTGASDHLVSEALYLHDPEGNGIELYRDRPRADWPRDEAGHPRMDSLPLDLPDVLDAADPNGGPAVDPATRIGHVHLQVGDLDAAERFYAGVLGLGVTSRSFPGARFLAAGGYHHHIGLNTWNSRGAGPAPAGMVGLRAYDLRFADIGERDAVLDRAAAAGLTTSSGAEAPSLADPSGNVVRLRAPADQA